MVLAAGGIAAFNVQHGYVEALVRGLRSGFLDDVDYHHLTQCESLEGQRAIFLSLAVLSRAVPGAHSRRSFSTRTDVKLNLQETDYDQFLADEVRWRLCDAGD